MPIKANVTTISEVLEDIDRAVNTFMALMRRTNPAKPEETPDEVLMFSPDEWEIITIALLYNQTATREFARLKGGKEEEEYLRNNSKFLSFLRDVLCKMESRLDQEVMTA